MLLTIAVTLAVLAVLILVHELGHYVAARIYDIGVPRFSIGFGPKVFGVQKGETEFRIGLLPLGGYVKMAGMDELAGLEGADAEEESDPARLFRSKSPATRGVVLAAGVVMNGLLAVVLFAVVAMVWGVPRAAEPVVADVVEDWLPPGATDLATIEPGSRITRVAGQNVATMDDVSRILMRAHAGPVTLEFAGRPDLTIEMPDNPRDRRFLPFALSPAQEIAPLVGDVAEGGAAAAAGLRLGDRVVAVNGDALENWQRLARLAEAHPGQPIDLTVDRDGTQLDIRVTPAATQTPVGTVGRLQAQPDPQALDLGRSRLPPLAAAGWGLRQSGDVVVLVADFVTGLIQGRYSALDMGGPVLIAQVSGAAARAGAPVLLFFVALLSANLAVINLLPIPALDGGQLMMLTVETVRGRPASDRTRRFLGRFGVTLVAAIMLWAVAADILRLLGH